MASISVTSMANEKLRSSVRQRVVLAGDEHDPVPIYSFVSTRCNARSTNFVGNCFRSVGLSRIDRASHYFGHIRRCASCRSNDVFRSLIRAATGLRSALS
jgi:hypothetical protein